MKGEEIATLAARPESVAEWEDLLVRLEIVPRVVRSTVDDVVNVGRAIRVLAEAAVRESEVGAWLEAAARVGEPSRASNGGSGSSEDPGELAIRFASLRARTFAMVQRRGLEVWEWEAPVGAAPVTVHQLLLWLARRDALLLADLREATGSRRGEC